MEYDPKHECLLLVTGGYRQQTVVWALKVRGEELTIKADLTDLAVFSIRETGVVRAASSM